MFVSPIRSTRCGHNFCERCLIDVTNGQESWPCPECRQNHDCPIEDLARGYLIEKCVEKLKKKQEEQPKNIFGTCTKHNRAFEVSKSYLSIQTSAPLNSGTVCLAKWYGMFFVNKVSLAEDNLVSEN